MQTDVRGLIGYKGGSGLVRRRGGGEVGGGGEI